MYTAMGPEHDVERLRTKHAEAEGFQVVKMRIRQNVHRNIVDMEFSLLNTNQ